MGMRGSPATGAIPRISCRGRKSRSKRGKRGAESGMRTRPPWRAAERQRGIKAGTVHPVVRDKNRPPPGKRLARHETDDCLAFIEPWQPDLEDSMTRDQLQLQLDKPLDKVLERHDELVLGRNRI